MKTSLYTAILILILKGCSAKPETTTTFWVSGFKVICDSGATKKTCLLVSKSQNLSEASWELFYETIEGLEFKEGIVQKVELDVTEVQGELVADQSALTYKLIKVLEEQQDERGHLAGQWQLKSIANTSTEPDSLAQTMTLDLSEMTVYGYAGCNTYKGAIKYFGIESISFHDLLNTLRMCEMQAVEDAYLNALRRVRSFKLQGSELHLMDEDDVIILSFTKMKETANSTRINDLWAAVRIGGYPINRMVTVPRLEVNTKALKIYGNDGCNEYFGTISTITETAVSFTNVGASKMLCPDMEVPQRYNDALHQVKSYSFDQRFLILSDVNGNEVLAFMKVD